MPIAPPKPAAHLCEKPISVNIVDAKAMIDAADKAGVVLQTAFPVRHAEPIRRLKAAVDAGKLGDIIAINATNHGKMPPGWFLDPVQAGGGAVMDHTVHVADIVRWMLKTEFTQVYAEVDTLLHDVDIDDCGMLTMELASGAIMSLDPSWSRPDTFTTWGDVTMELIGTKGVASIDVFRQAGMLYVANRPSSPGGVYEQPWGNDADRELIEAFIAPSTASPTGRERLGRPQGHGGRLGGIRVRPAGSPRCHCRWRSTESYVRLCRARLKANRHKRKIK